MQWEREEDGRRGDWNTPKSWRDIKIQRSKTRDAGAGRRGEKRGEGKSKKKKRKGGDERKKTMHFKDGGIVTGKLEPRCWKQDVKYTNEWKKMFLKRGQEWTKTIFCWFCWLAVQCSQYTSGWKTQKAWLLKFLPEREREREIKEREKDRARQKEGQRETKEGSYLRCSLPTSH